MRTIGVCVCAIFVLGGGCAVTKEVRKGPPPVVSLAREAPPPATPGETAVERRPAPSVPLPDAPVAATEEPKGSVEEFRRPAARYTVVMAGAEARELFLSLAKENDFNLLLAPEVTGTITLDVKEATASEVMEEVCGILGCRIEYAGKTVRVLPAKTETRIFRLDYLLTARSGTGSLTASTSAGGSGASSTSATAGAGGAASSAGESQSSNTVSTEERLDLWTGILEEIRSLLPAEEGRVIVNRATGTVAVTAYPGQLAKVEEYLRTLEGRLRSGVTIETRILEVTLDDQTQYGINWAAFPDLSGVSLTGSLAGGAAVRQTLPSGTTAFQIGVSGSKFEAFLDALSQQGQIHVLSAPKLSTLNNQRAIIRIGRQDVFFRATVTPASTTSAAFVTFSPDTITEGIILSVTPQVGRDGNVLLAIHPSITEKVGDATAPDGNTAPIVDVRETNTVVSVKDGQTVFIGGLMQERTQETVKAVPLLGDIPYLGALFRSNVQEKRKTELVILITPRVHRAEAAAEIAGEEWDRALAAERGYRLGGRPWLYGTQGERQGMEAW